MITDERLQEIRQIVTTPQAWTREADRNLACELLEELDRLRSTEVAVADTCSKARLPWSLMSQPDAEPITYLGPPSFAEGVVVEFQPEARGLVLDHGNPRMLNGAGVPDGHHYAIIDAEGDTLSTAPTREAAIETAAREEIRSMWRSLSMAKARLKRVLAAVKTIESGGA